MTEESARKVANAVLGAAAVGVVYVVLRNPPLRRLAWRLAAVALTTTLPHWLRHEVVDAWQASARPERMAAASVDPLDPRPSA